MKERLKKLWLISLILSIFLSIYPNFSFARRVKGVSREDRAKAIYDETATPLEKIKYRVDWGKAYLEEGGINEALGYFNEAIQLAQQQLSVRKEIPYRLNELLMEALERRGDCYRSLGKLEYANSDYLSAIEIYIQLEQYQQAIALYKKVAEINKEVLESFANKKPDEKDKEKLKSVAKFFQCSIPFLERISGKVESEVKSIIPKARYYAGLAYRKLEMFTLAGVQFETAYQEFKEIQSNSAFVWALLSALFSGECFIKAGELGEAYNIYKETESLLTNNQISRETIKEYIPLPLIQIMINFLKERFPRKEANFINFLEELIRTMP